MIMPAIDNNIRHWTARAPAVRQRGASIVEIMVAITIGSILMVGLIEIFASNRQAYRLQQSLSLMQENGRFAMNKLSQSIRMSDHWAGAEAKQVQDTSAGAITGIGACDHAWITDFKTAIRGFEGASTVSGVGLPAGCIATSDYVPDSDVLVLRYANTSEAVRSADLGKTSNPDNADTVFIRTSIERGSMAILGSAGIPASIPDEDGTYNFPYAFELYYLRKCSKKSAGVCSDNIPTLTRLRLSSDSASAPALIEEAVAENIEQVQFNYGRDTNGDGDADRYDPARDLSTADWAQVVDVQISLVARAGQNDQKFADSSSYALLDYVFTPASADQYFHRKQYDRIIQIRNRTRK